MDTLAPNDLDAALAKVDRLITSIDADLRRMPDFKRNTRYHTDRVAERRRLLSQRDYLLARQAEMVLAN